MKMRNIFRLRVRKCAMLIIICTICGLLLEYQELRDKKWHYDAGEMATISKMIKTREILLKDHHFHEELYGEIRRQKINAINRTKIRPSVEEMVHSLAHKTILLEATERNTKHSLERNSAVDDDRIKACHENHITEKYSKANPKKEQVTLLCKPHRSSSQDCLYAKEVYKVDESLFKCKHSDSKSYCDVTYDSHDLKIRCNESKGCSSYELKGLDNSSGELKIMGRFKNAKDTETGLLKISKRAMREKSYFVFIYCLNKQRRKIGQQLIILPSIDFNKKPFEAEVPSPNINVVLLDSLSRAHFYRSLPIVINKFNEINAKSDTEILDFELFQSVHGHSAENFHALFTGKLFHASMSDAERESKKVGVDKLLNKFKGAGYETMYQDDLCWKIWWGTRMELGSPSNWTSFMKEIRRSKIDTTGITFSSCGILQANQLDTPFNGPDSSQICFNGRFQHSYIFQFLHQFHKETDVYKTRPRFSFTTINTAHDYKGLRVQTLNIDLSQFVQEMSLLPNTMTVLLADHGNTYTQYTNDVIEGRYEMFHPSFFMIIPRGVARYFGDDVMTSLRINKIRLFTMLDVHASLKSVSQRAKNNEVKENQGIFQTISANRTCDDLSLRLPNLCVCEGWDTQVKNNTKQLGVLEFAVGTLNNMILKQQESQAEFTTKCNRLYPLYFSNVRERSTGGNLITTMDFRVKAGLGADQNEDIFHVEIQSDIHPDRNSMNMKLVNFDRLSQYGVYRKCKDERVDTRLCVCSLNDLNKSQRNGKQNIESVIEAIMSQQQRYKNIPGKIRIESVPEENCIFMLRRNYFSVNDQGKINKKDYVVSSVEFFNICQGKPFELEIGTEQVNMKTSGSIPMFKTLKSMQIEFLAVFIKHVPYWKSRLRIFVSVKRVT